MSQPVPEALFDGPGSTTAVKWADHLGQLVLIWPHLQKPFTFQDGKVGDVIEARVVVLDPPGGQPVEYDQTVVFPKRLQGQIRSNIGKNRPNLGRVTQQPEPGKNPSWVISEPTEADKQLATRFLTGNVTTVPPQPSTQAAQPQGAWGQQAGQGQPVQAPQWNNGGQAAGQPAGQVTGPGPQDPPF